MDRALYPLRTDALPRRQFLYRSTSLAAAAMYATRAGAAVASKPALTSYPFTLGVASGDPWPDGFVIWTRLAPDPLNGGGMKPEPVNVSWQVAEDERFTKVVKRGTHTARPEWAHAVHVEVDQLLPNRWYYYRFFIGNDVSATGRARTMPLTSDAPDRLKFAFASCQHYEAGFFTAYQHMLLEDVDFVIHLGDYIYEGAGKEGGVRKHIGAEIQSLEDYRTRHAQYRRDPFLREMHAACPWIITWDDHEFDNNYASDISEEANVEKGPFMARRAAAYQAFWEHMPLRRASLPQGPHMRVYRQLTFGRLASFFVLDERQYRTNQPCNDKNEPPCPETFSPNATMLGAAQKGWLKSGLASSPTLWNVLAQQLMMARVDRLAGAEIGYSMDQWPGYEIERSGLINFFAEARVRNPIVLTGDIHTNWANELTIGTDTEYKYPVAAEFVGTSISSGGDGAIKPGPYETIRSENPMVKFYNGERGYVTCEVTPEQWLTKYRTLDYVTRPASPINTRASFVVEPGSSKLQEA